MGWTYTLDELGRAIGAEPPDLPGPFQHVSTDSRTLQPGDVFFALTGPNFDGNRFVADAFAKGAAAAVTTAPNRAGPCLVAADPLKALQTFAAHHRARYAIPIFAVTGSCGKTMSKDLAAGVLATRHTVVKTPGNLNNDIGCPLSLLQIDADTGIAVIEMGANHRGEIAGLCALARPTESAITMIGPAHLEGFGSVENVAKAKAEIVEALGPTGVFYVNADDAWCARIAESFSGEKVRFGRSGDVVLEACRYTGPGEMALRVSPVGALRLPLAVRAHVTNVLLAIAVGLRHGVTEFEGPLREVCAVSARFKVVRVGPLLVMDDAYNANPASMAASIEALVEWPGSGARIAALGEMLELGDAAGPLHGEIGALAGRLGVGHVFAQGPHARDTIDAARAAGVPSAEVIDDPRTLAEAILRIGRPGDMVLVKGSRGARMELVVEALRERCT
jgi:UDP-N-acetylmuramoyl-tripeptide--D-alanyl-D-alanine ligase